MADVLTTITNLINSPPGQFVAGGVLAGIVWKFFDKVEAVLTDQTKFEIAVWLVGVKVAQKVEPWPETFAKMFDRVFGTRHLTWTCFVRSAGVSLAAILMSYVISFFHLRISQPKVVLTVSGFVFATVTGLVANVVPDYVSLLKTRLLVGKMGRLAAWTWPLIVVVDGLVDVSFGYLAVILGSASSFLIYGPRTDSGWIGSMYLLRDWIGDFIHFRIPGFEFWIYPAFFTSIWLWLYAGSGFLLKAARRFDIGFNWFNRKFDIEKKPLSAIGLVAGALVAMVYWGFAVGAYLMKK